MGSKPPPKRESMNARTARIVTDRKGSADYAALRAQGDYLRNSRRRAPLFGGPEGAAPTVASNRLGVQ